MTSGKDTSTMGESPIFTCKAHVFHIDPKTKRSWVPASSTQVNVSFFYDNTRALYRIISVEAQKAVINSTVTPTMTFTKTSQKFGQWSDVRANTVYGLGFGTEVELQKFIDKFNEVKEATRSSAINKTTSPAAQVTNGGGGATTPANASPITTRVATAVAPPIDPTDNLLEPPTGNSLLSTNEEEDLPLPLQHPQHPRSSFSSTGKVDIMENSPSHQSKISSPICDNNNSVMQQLKYENDRLKLALAQSSANAKKWEHELATLKSNNARLTSALQESTANVDEWKRQLASLKDENLKMKNKYQTDLENSKGGGELADELRKEIQNLRIRVAELENGLESKNVDHTELRKEQDEMQTTLKLAQSELEMANSTYESQKRILLALNQQFAGRIHELAAIHDEITQALES